MMTAMLLALVFADCALNSNDDPRHRTLEQDGFSPPASDLWAWSPTSKLKDEMPCPAFFQREIGGFGAFGIGPRCREDDGLPHAL